jgi:hypothetical protein
LTGSFSRSAQAVSRRRRLPEHGLLYLLSDHGADFAEVFADLLDLLGGAV